MQRSNTDNQSGVGYYGTIETGKKMHSPWWHPQRYLPNLTPTPDRVHCNYTPGCEEQAAGTMDRWICKT